MSNPSRIVVKIGSSLVIGEGNRAREAWMASLAEDIAALRKQGTNVVLVSSGAVALGRGVLGLPAKRTLSLEEKQAAAACGQTRLMAAWEAAFATQKLHVAQVLLTADDGKHRRRYLNARATLNTLLAHGVVPIINENDTVATAELRFGDNDRLSALAAMMAEADQLVILSDVAGFYREDPAINPSAELIREVKDITPELEALAGGAGSAAGTGGMRAKLEAAKMALAAGCETIIASGREEHPLKAVQGTRFIAHETPRGARKNWIASLPAMGTLQVDEGAAKALLQGKSLLPAGVKSVSGTFERGDAVAIEYQGKKLGKGLSAYGSTEAAKLCGKQSSEIEAIVGFKGRSELIHRDDYASI